MLVLVENLKIISFFTADEVDAALTSEFEPIFAQFTDGMSDREKVELCVKAVCDRFDYAMVTGQGFDWTNGLTTGDCDNFSSAINEILGAAGIPCFKLAGTVRDGEHSWNQAYIDGEWLIIDGGAADVGYGMTMTMPAHEKLYGYAHKLNEKPVTHALVETAEKYR